MQKATAASPPLDEIETSHEEISQSDFESLYSPLYTSDIVSGRLSPPPFLFSPIFRSRTITMLSSEPFVGKTLIMLSMLLTLDLRSVTPDTRFLSRFETAPNHRCLFFGQDAPTWDYHSQIFKLFSGVEPSVPKESILPSLFLLNRGIDITSPSFVNLIKNIISLYGITVIFFDTLLEFHNFDENSNRDMSRVMRILKYLRDKFHLTIVFSHHVSKPSGGFAATPNYRARGASVISGTVDHHFFLSKRQSSVVSLEIAKGRGLADASHPIQFNITPTPNGGLSLQYSEPSSQDLLLSFLSSPRSRSDIDQFLSAKGASPSKISRLLDSLRESGLITQQSHGVWSVV